ncbi:hypothetical protein AVEN_152129-1 [Araneus ventricosus]|uniref:Uncharacterized protein n=1 Tax=Araneus ventricosus TaxID=182803 RepID=A0A4Y2IUZ3_ARAVE|nr:hypothetical protein AVEN_152129-1 [Araneus ventricosus]
MTRKESTAPPSPQMPNDIFARPQPSITHVAATRLQKGLLAKQAWNEIPKIGLHFERHVRHILLSSTSPTTILRNIVCKGTSLRPRHQTARIIYHGVNLLQVQVTSRAPFIV